MSLTSYRAAPPRGNQVPRGNRLAADRSAANRKEGVLLGRLGSVRLSHVLGRSTIGAEGFHGRVRNGIGCFAPRYNHQVVQARIRQGTKPFVSVRTRGRHGQALAGSAMHVAGRKEFQADRAIRIGKLNALPRFHIRPINVVVYHDSSGRPRLKVGFPLRCIQRLSRPHIATRRCRWRDNRYTRGASIPVLSY